MIRFVLIASLLAGCRLSLEPEETSEGRACVVSTTSPTCLDAENGNHASLAFIEENIFRLGCALDSCHGGANTPAGKLDLRIGKSHAHLVNVASTIDPTRKLVVPNDVSASYLMLMVRDFPPSEASPPGEPPPKSIDYMPKGNGVLCCQKLEALERWIMAGAPTN